MAFYSKSTTVIKLRIYNLNFNLPSKLEMNSIYLCRIFIILSIVKNRKQEISSKKVIDL